MLSGTCPSSPAALCAPRSSLPSTAMPTPTPSETLTNATGPSTGASPRTAHTCPSMQAFIEFSTTTGSFVAAFSGSRSSTSRQPRVGENSDPPAGVHQPRDRDPDADALAELRVALEQAGDGVRHVLDELLRAAAGRELGHVEERMAEHVGDQEGGVARAHVDRRHAAAAGLDVEVHGLAPARALALRALEDESRLEQLVDQAADRARGARP